MTVYNLRRAGDGYRITKFTNDLEVEASYNLSADQRTCDCPAGARPTCKHRKMLPRMMSHLDDGWFYDYEHQNWRHPLEDRPDAEGVQPEPATAEIAHSIDLPEDADVAAEFAKLLHPEPSQPAPLAPNHVSRR